MLRSDRVIPENIARRDVLSSSVRGVKTNLPDWAIDRLKQFDYSDDLRLSVTHELSRYWPNLDAPIFAKLPPDALAPLFDALASSVRGRLTNRVQTLREVKTESDSLARKIRANLIELAALLRQEQQLSDEYGVTPWVSGLHEGLDGVSQLPAFRAHRSVTGLDDALNIWINTSQRAPQLVDLVEFIAEDYERSAGQSIVPHDFPPNTASRAIPELDLFDDALTNFFNSAHVDRPTLNTAQKATLYSAVIGGDYSVDAVKKRAGRARLVALEVNTDGDV